MTLVCWQLTLDKGREGQENEQTWSSSAGRLEMFTAGPKVDASAILRVAEWVSKDDLSTFVGLCAGSRPLCPSLDRFFGLAALNHSFYSIDALVYCVLCSLKRVFFAFPFTQAIAIAETNPTVNLHTTQLFHHRPSASSGSSIVLIKLTSDITANNQIYSKWQPKRSK